jgi:hypothetical protein
LNAPSSLRSSFFRALSSPYFLSSAPSSPWPSKVVRFLTLPSFSSAPLSPCFPFERAFEPSPSFRARLWALASLRARLWALVYFSSMPLSHRFLFERAFEP